MTAPATATSAEAPSFLGRLTAYPLVKYGYETTLHLYKEAKETNNYVRLGLELAESSVGTVAASPLLLNVSKSCEPLLSKADQFGCSQLDRAEVSIFKPAVQLYASANATLASSKKLVEEKVADSKKLVAEKVVQPISATYQHLVALPTVLTNQVFDFAQDSVDFYLPEETDGEKDASLVQAEEASQPQEANNNTVKTKSVWARSSTLSQCAYRRVQRKAAHRVRIARLYGESVLTKSPLAVSVVNYVRTRDPEIRDTLVQQAKTTITYYTDKTKGFVAETPLFKQTADFVQPYLANLSYQSFYALLLTLLATVVPTAAHSNADKQSATATATATASASASSSSSTAATATTTETVTVSSETTVDEQPVENTADNVADVQPEKVEEDHGAEEQEDKHFDDDEHADNDERFDDDYDKQADDDEVAAE